MIIWYWIWLKEFALSINLEFSKSKWDQVQSRHLLRSSLWKIKEEETWLSRESFRQSLSQPDRELQRKMACWRSLAQGRIRNPGVCSLRAVIDPQRAWPWLGSWGRLWCCWRLLWVSPVAQCKESAYHAGDVSLSPGSRNPLEEGMAIHFSILAQRNPWAEEPGGLQSMGL